MFLHVHVQGPESDFSPFLLLLLLLVALVGVRRRFFHVRICLLTRFVRVKLSITHPGFRLTSPSHRSFVVDCTGHRNPLCRGLQGKHSSACFLLFMSSSDQIHSAIAISASDVSAVLGCMKWMLFALRTAPGEGNKRMLDPIYMPLVHPSELVIQQIPFRTFALHPFFRAFCSSFSK